MLLLVNIITCISFLHAQVVYQCNFDSLTTGGTDNCFFGVGGSFAMIKSERMTALNSTTPNVPLSDVTAALTPTTNGQLCNLPYSSPSFTRPIYFCYNNFCPTDANPTSTCTTGKFGHYAFGPNRNYTFILKGNEGFNATSDQCLTYYYYLFNTTGLDQHIQVTKQESDGTSQVIDYVRGSPLNGWIKREVEFSAVQLGYKIYFDLIKLAGPLSPLSVFAFDEISIVQGRCSDLSTTTRVSTATSTTLITGTSTTTITTTATTTTTSTTIETATTTTTTSSSTTVASISPTIFTSSTSGIILSTTTTQRLTGSSSILSTTSGQSVVNSSSTSKTNQTVITQSTIIIYNTTANGSSINSTVAGENSSSSVPLALGLAVGLLFLLVIVGVIVYVKCFRGTKVVPETIELESTH